ncbi:presenilin-1-like [Rhipicephalus microplus]|uniref:presenilin-1-like n=1 Tax=Rhipicephalus microplus TaxID=6941 RepID=UPI003F6C162F
MSGSVEKAETPEAIGRRSPAATTPPLPVAEMDADDVRRLLLKLYDHLMRQVITLIAAVSICMLSVSVLTRMLRESRNENQQLGYWGFPDSAGAETVVLMYSFENAFSFLMMIVIVNCALVFLYKGGYYSVIQAWMVSGSGALLFLTGYYYMGRVATYFNAPMDYVTCSFVIWNVGATGITALYRDGPFLMKQGYLVYISVLLAVTLEESFPEWTSWILLVLVSAWDIFAVLCVLGPLRILLETAKERGEPLFPALVFSTSSAWCYAIRRSSVSLTRIRSSCEAISGRDKELPQSDLAFGNSAFSGEMTSKHADRASQPAPSIQSGLALAADEARASSASQVNEESTVSYEDTWLSVPNEATDPPYSNDKTKGCWNEFNVRASAESTDGKRSTPTLAAADTAVRDDRGGLHLIQPVSYHDAGGATVDRQPLQGAGLSATPPTALSHRCPHDGRPHHRRRVIRSQAELSDEMSGDRGMKMGLGDFIFYSVLVGKASRHGTALTVIACYVSIIVGILLTLSLLVYLQKPLPALPFSISLGIAAYFSCSFLTEPFIGDMDAIVF